MPDAVMAIITRSIVIAITIVMALSVDLLSSSLSFPSVYQRDCKDKDEALPKLFSTYRIEHQPFDNRHQQPHQSPSDGPPSHLSSCLQITISMSSELNINHSNLFQTYLSTLTMSLCDILHQSTLASLDHTEFPVNQ